jgi:hypothetical protein
MNQIMVEQLGRDRQRAYAREREADRLAAALTPSSGGSTLRPVGRALVWLAVALAGPDVVRGRPDVAQTASGH